MTDSNHIFFGTEEQAKKFLKHVKKYYVYGLHRPNLDPFYIGKGTGRRAVEHAREARQGPRLHEANPHKNNIFRKIWRNSETAYYAIFSEHENEQDAYNREAELIEKYGRFCDGGCLANLAPGGGSSLPRNPLSTQRHEATLSGISPERPLRSILNTYLQSIGPVKSVPIKPLNQVKLRHSEPHTQPRRPTLRGCYALIASASANGIMLKDRAIIPRVFIFENVTGVIESGVSRDILKSGLASLVSAKSPCDEAYLLNAHQVTLITSIYGAEKLKALGLI